jgi:hypothetical protein
MSFDMNVEAGKVKKTFTVAGRQRNRVRKTVTKKVNGVRERRQTSYLQITTPHTVTLATQQAQTRTHTHTLKKKEKKRKKNSLFSKGKRRSQTSKHATIHRLSEPFLSFSLRISI